MPYGIPSRQVWLAAGGVAIAAFVLYFATLAPTVTLVDSGELIVVARELGVAHPPGFPLYTLLAHAATWVPVGNVAERVHLASAVFGALASGMMVWLVFVTASVALRPTSREGRSKTAPLLGAVAGGLMLATSRTVWSYATVAEVYTLSVLCLTGALALAVTWRAGVTGSMSITPYLSIIYGLALVVGLGASVHHVSMALVVPALAIAVLSAPARSRLTGRAATIAGACVLVGLLPYVYLPIAAATEPLINWGDPDSPGRFVAHVSGWQYQVFVSWSLDTMAAQVRESLVPFVLRDGGLPSFPIALVLAGAGLVRLHARDRVLARVLVAVIVVDVIYALNYDIDEDQDAYYLPAFIAIAAAAGVGAAWLASIAARSTRLVRLSVAAALVATPAMALAGNWPYANRSRDVIASDYVGNILSTVAPRGLLLTLDWQVYSPWLYRRHVEAFRPDVVAVDVNLLRRSWYFPYLEREYPALMSAARPAVDAYVQELLNWEADPAAYNRDVQLNRRINERFHGLISTLASAHSAQAPVYVTQELLTQDPAMAAVFSSYHAVPQGLVFELRTSPGFIEPAEPRLEMRGLFDGTLAFSEDHVVRQKVQPVYVTMLVNRGRYLAANGFPERAAALYREALSLDPSSLAARQSLGALGGR